MIPSKYTSDEDAEKVYDTMPPRDGGIRAGTLVSKARAAGLRDDVPASERFKEYIASAEAETVVQPSIDEDQYGWRFDTFNAADDASLPPITYHDENRLWPNIPGGSLTQIIAQAKGYKTTFYLSELFRLVARELKAESE